MPRLETGMRERIAKFLPRALETALLSYHEFAEEQATAPDDEEERRDDKAKTFRAHHDACKIALAHIQLLIDLARWADLPDPEIEDENAESTLRMLLINAEAEVDANRNRA